MLQQFQHQLIVTSTGRGFYDITPDVAQFVAEQGVEMGIVHLFVKHTSCSLLVQENADPDVRDDLETFLSQLIPESATYRHQNEGPDDMPSHIRTALTQVSLSIPVHAGTLTLGTWQSIFLYEHRAARFQRHIQLHLIGE
ncbi:MAG: YjbQ family protein [Zetaproteobacteria bacterium]|nr:YjbQ family protein [Zetaproteobacteria bacterium]